MLIRRLEEFTKGWIIGDFDPTLLKTQDFEIAIKMFEAGEVDAVHYHKRSTEYNVLISGRMSIQEQILTAGDCFVIYPNEVSNPQFLEKCTVLVCKVPFTKNDKYLVGDV